LFVINQGLPKAVIGIVFFGTMIPVIIMEILLSKFGKKMGEEFFFKLGFAILALCGVGMFIINNPIWVLSLIVVSGVGAGCIEPTQETFFFRLASKKNEKKLFSIFLTSTDTGLLFSKLFGASLLILLDFKVVFLGLGFVMISIFFVVRKS